MKGTNTQSFEEFFQRAAGFSPYEFQVHMATGAELPRLVRIPTGLGKTAAVVLSWLWRRRFADSEVRKSTPRRLVYCLPMRVLVEQVRDVVQSWLKNLRLEEIAVHVLMGGEEAEDWDLYPERDAILIGTQDMLLSRALNRGYGVSRYRWPMCFGLLNNDCLWVFDEVQLMGVGVATSAQLEAFRRKLGTFQQVPSIWMSATLDPTWLRTIDFEPEWLGQPLELSHKERRQPDVAKRYGAVKPLQQASAAMGQDVAIAKEIVGAHEPGTLTLAIFNTVARARSVYMQLDGLRPRLPKDVRLLLIHSRYRPPDREHLIAQLLAQPTDGGTIAITTQVVEAGVDVSAMTLFTELAPWASLVQRFGRCNRRGEFSPGDGTKVIWVDLPRDPDEQNKSAAPYALEDLLEAQRALKRCSDVGPHSLEGLQVELRLEVEHVIRRRDFIDLFDTTPDLAGNDIDVSRFIRSGEDLDVYVFWRDVPKDVSKPDLSQLYGAAPRREELCPVPVSELRKFYQNHKSDMWRWDALEQEWAEVSDELIYAGQILLVRASAGGYSSASGWDGSFKQMVKALPPPELPPEAYDEDRSSAIGVWETLPQHTDKLSQALDEILAQLSIPSIAKQLLRLAARFHDLGKAHPVFQNALPDGKPSNANIWAKAAGNWKRYERKHFRHELASALAVLQANLDQLNRLSSKERSLVAYLVAAHHGKVRLSIRSLPGERTPDNRELLYARGIWEGDELPEVDLGSGIVVPSTRLSLEPMQLGRGPHGEPSWTGRMLELRDAQDWGPLRLSYLEAILRAADIRVSHKVEHDSKKHGREEG